MRYCSDECCRIATNKRIMEKYYERKAKMAQPRFCAASHCGTKLNKYNSNDYCSVCQSATNKRDKDILLGMIGN